MGRLSIPTLTTDEIQTYGLFFQGGAILLSAIGLGFTLWMNRSIARKRATLDILLMEQTNADVIQERRMFIQVRSAGKLLDWVDDKHADAPERRGIRATLNLYEFVAVGIREKTLDEKLYRRSYRSTLVQDWIDLKPFVMQMRLTTGHPTFYCEYEKLVRKWATAAERRLV